MKKTLYIFGGVAALGLIALLFIKRMQGQTTVVNTPVAPPDNSGAIAAQNFTPMTSDPSISIPSDATHSTAINVPMVAPIPSNYSSSNSVSGSGCTVCDTLSSIGASLTGNSTQTDSQTTNPTIQKALSHTVAPIAPTPPMQGPVIGGPIKPSPTPAPTPLPDRNHPVGGTNQYV